MGPLGSYIIAFISIPLVGIQKIRFFIVVSVVSAAAASAAFLAFASLGGGFSGVFSGSGCSGSGGGGGGGFSFDGGFSFSSGGGGFVFVVSTAGAFASAGVTAFTATFLWLRGNHFCRRLNLRPWLLGICFRCCRPRRRFFRSCTYFFLPAFVSFCFHRRRLRP